MIITAFFSASGTPKTGLSPTVNIRRIDTGALVITAGAMSEVGDGFYKYDFTTYSAALEYSILCDGTSTLTGYDRYATAALDANNDVLATAANLATVDTVVDAIKAKTDSLTFAFSGKVDANIKAVNNTTVTGDGSTLTPWGPA
jgi:hypothetical protein